MAKKSEIHNKIWEWGMYLLSMALFAIIILILCFPFEIHFGDKWMFVGWSEVWKWLWWFPLVFILILFIDLFMFIYLKYYIIKGTQHISCEIIQIKSLQGDVLAFLASYFIPLVSFCLDKPTHQIVLLILFATIGIFYVNGDLYYQNPTLSLLGFRTYSVTCDFGKGSLQKERKILCLSNLNKGDKIGYIPLSKDVWFAIKTR